LEVLHSTLEDRLPLWRKEINNTRSIWCGRLGYCCVNKEAIQRTWVERIGIAKCIASALQFLHSESIIYRDLKPENIGFDPDGQVKVFDFGLSKRLLPDDRAANGLYRLTGNTGSLRYMAPEVARNEYYNTKADSYSFAIVLWQLCALTVPYAGYNVRMHADLVVGKGHRPNLHRSWPLSWGELMKACWATDIETRYDFNKILAILDDEYQVSMSSWNGTSFSGIRAKKKDKVEVLDPDDEIKLSSDTRRPIFEPDDFEMAEGVHDIDII
jgi:serine/threonine protein kinase